MTHENRTAIIADVHLGSPKRMGGALTGSINTRGKLTLDTLLRATNEALAQECSILVVAGDLFDEHDPPAQLIDEAASILGGACKRGLEVILVPGNHDRHSLTPGDNAMSPLAHAGCSIIEEPLALLAHCGQQAQHTIICVPCANEDAPLKEVLRTQIKTAMAVQEDFKARPRVLVGHFGVIDHLTAPWLRAASNAILVDDLREICEEFDIWFVCAGDWHEHKCWHYPNGGECVITQVGALNPTGFDNPGSEGYGSLIIIDPKDKEWSRREIPGPRFISTTAHEKGLPGRLEGLRKEGHSVFLQLKTSTQDTVQSKVSLDSMSPYIISGEVALTGEQGKTRDAAEVTKSTATLAQSLARFVESLPVPDGVDRARVLSMSRSYLKL